MKTDVKIHSQSVFTNTEKQDVIYNCFGKSVFHRIGMFMSGVPAFEMQLIEFRASAENREISIRPAAMYCRGSVNQFLE